MPCAGFRKQVFEVCCPAQTPLSRETSRWRGWRGSEGTRTWNFLTVAAVRCTRAICSLSSSETVMRRFSSRVTPGRTENAATCSPWVACAVLDFVDGGLPSTYLCDLDELLNLYDLFRAHAASQGATCMVVEIADGLLQNETAALLQSSRFSQTVDTWIFAAGDPLAAAA